MRVWSKNRHPTGAGEARIVAELEKFDDWEGKCRRCGVVLKGTLKQMREHICGEQSK